MKYKLSDNRVIRDDGASIPLDIGNRDYREYLDWLSAGNIPDLADPKPLVTSINTDSHIIIGDGADEILLSVQGKADTLVTIDVLTGATPSTINIQLDSSGNGVQAFSCDTSPTVIVFSHGDISAKVRAL